MGLEHRYLEMFAHARDDYARQLPGGRGYTRVEAPLTPEVVRAHLSGEITLGLYLLDERDTVRYGVLDHDGEQVARDAWGMPLRNETGPAPRIYKDGEAMLQEARALLAREGIAAAVERSRRGAHLWLFAAESVPARDMRALLLLAAPDRALEVYPRQDSRGGGVGSMIRAPLGIHRTSGARYGFVGPEGEPVASTLAGQIGYLERLPCVDVTAELARRPHLRQIRAALDGSLLPQVQMVPPAPVHPVPGWEQGRNAMRATMRAAIRAWVESVRLEDVVRAYIPLSRSGLAHCPWPEHHKNGDAHPSFVVLTRIQRWRCYASGQHGDAFDFVARMEGHASARETLAYVRRRWPTHADG